MNFLQSLFSPNRALPQLNHAPPDAQWHNVRPRESATSVTARLADSDGGIDSDRGRLRYRRRRDYIVEHTPGDEAVVERDTFERTYRLRDDGRFQKRTDVTYRYFQLPRAVTVRTEEGLQHADANDWIIEGLNGEIWPVHEEEARKIYEAV
jgi:hypothetical protein